jgi:hypothetical protein
MSPLVALGRLTVAAWLCSSGMRPQSRAEP